MPSGDTSRAGQLAAAAAAVGATAVAVSLLQRAGRAAVGCSARAPHRQRGRHADLSQQELTELGAEAIAGLSDAVGLNCAGNWLSAAPVELAALQRLRTLNLSGNKLTEFPAAVCALRGLEELDLGRNEIASVPADIGHLLRLTALNLQCNWVGELPPEIGRLRRMVRLGLKGNRLERLPPEIGNLQSLKELFLSDNQLVALPPELGKLKALVKLQVSWNRLASLPPELGRLLRLELMRVAVNRLAAVPRELGDLPRLAWFSLAGNPAARRPPATRKVSSIRAVAFERLPVQAVLGKGASGDVFLSELDGEAVAVKVFKSEVSPDGHAADEIAITECLDHACLSRVLGDTQEPHAIVLRFVAGATIADRPNSESLLRCRWAPGTSYTAAWVARVGACVASALAYMHARGICHGDVYAHNILADSDGQAVLCDYGASFFYDGEGPGAAIWEPMEVRAFGLFLEGLAQCIAGGRQPPQLRTLIRQCLAAEPSARPGFGYVGATMTRLVVAS